MKPPVMASQLRIIMCIRHKMLKKCGYLNRKIARRCGAEKISTGLCPVLTYGGVLHIDCGCDTEPVQSIYGA